MKILLELQVLRSPWSTQSLRRLFHQYHKSFAPLNFSEYEAISRCEQEVPEYFNFASDVLDKWSRIEEVIIIPGTTQLTAQDIGYRLLASKVKCIITTDVLAPAADSVASKCQFLKTKLIVSESSRAEWLNFSDLLKAAPAVHNRVKTKSQDPTAIYFTSGSAGSPKTVEHSYGSFGLGSFLCGRYWMNLTPSDVMWNMSDTAWVKAAIGSGFGPWFQGTCVFVHAIPQFDSRAILNGHGFILRNGPCASSEHQDKLGTPVINHHQCVTCSADVWSTVTSFLITDSNGNYFAFHTLCRYPVTTLCSAPTAYCMLVQHDLTRYTFKTPKHCLTGGEPLNPEVMAQWKSQTGLSTKGMICANMKGMKIKPGSLGKAAPPYDVQIIDENGSVLPPGKGDVAIKVDAKRPFTFFTRYLDDPVKTASMIRGNFYITGDRGSMDEDGYIWFTGRSDDVIISSGYRIGPFEVESALIQHPAVVESAAVSSPDAIREEVVKTFVVFCPSFKSQDPKKLAFELQDHIKNVTAPYKYPRKIEFVRQLPKTITGKIRRNELRNKEWGQV